MNLASKNAMWLLLPIGTLAAGALIISSGLTSAQTPEPTATTPAQTPSGASSEVSYDQMLAEELGISVDELRAAQSTARDRYIDSLADAGDLTAEQAASLKASSSEEVLSEAFGLRKIPEFLTSLLADTVGIDPEALEQGLNEGKSLDEIAEEQGIDAQQVRTDLESTVNDLVNMAEQSGFLEPELASDLRTTIQGLIDELFDDETDTSPSGGETPTSTPAPSTP